MKQHFSKQVGINIRNYRKSKGIRLDELAAQICKSRATVSKYENGSVVIDVNTLKDISNVLKVPTHLLMDAPEKTNRSQIADRKESPIIQYFYSLSEYSPLEYVGGKIYIFSQNDEYAGPIEIITDNMDIYKGHAVITKDEFSFNIKSDINPLDILEFMGIRNTFSPDDNYYGLAIGVSFKTPIVSACKAFITKNKIEDSAAIIEQLKIDAEDIRQLRKTGHLHAK